MEKKEKIGIRTLRFPINSDLGNCEERLKYEINQIWRESRVRNVDVKTSHTDQYLIYDIIYESY